MASAEQLFIEARKLHQAGDCEAAVPLYRELLAAAPHAHAPYLLGMALVQLQRHEEAIAPLQQITQLRPGFIDGWIALGDAHLKLEQFGDAWKAYRGAVRVDPNCIKAVLQMAEVLSRKEDWDRLKAFTDSMAERFADSAPLLRYRLQPRHAQQDYVEGIFMVIEFLQQQPECDKVYRWYEELYHRIQRPGTDMLDALAKVDSLRGRSLWIRALIRAKECEAAKAAFADFQRDDPEGKVMKPINMGLIFKNEKFHAEAEPFLLQALVDNPKNFPFIGTVIDNLLALAKNKRPEKFAEARELAQIWLDAKPDDPDALAAMGGIYSAASRPELALPYQEKLLERNPKHPIRASRLFVINYDERLDPDTVFAAHQAWGRDYEAGIPESVVRILAPDGTLLCEDAYDAEKSGSLSKSKSKSISDNSAGGADVNSESEESEREASDRDPISIPISISMSQQSNSADAEKSESLSKSGSKSISDNSAGGADVNSESEGEASDRDPISIPIPISIKPRTVITAVADPNKRLRIGYLSPDLGHHPVGTFFIDVFKAHAFDQFDFFLYSNRFPDEGDDARSQAFRKVAGPDRWRWTRGWDAADLIKQIRRDEIDILVEMAGHTAYNRLDVIAHRAAPIQVEWLGYPNTTGLTRMDYRFSDAVTEPYGEFDARSTERIYRLPNGFHMFSPPDYTPLPSPAPCLKNGYVTFGTYNNMNKLGSQSIELWADLLKRVPRSRIIIKHSTLAVLDNRESLRSQFAKYGIQTWRVDLRETTAGHKEHLESYADLDIALDPLFYNGTTTTCDALSVGVPVLTLPGATHSARVSASLVHRIGMDGWIARDREHFLEIGRRASQNFNMLNDIRVQIRAAFDASPLRDGLGMARDLESAYREMWQAFCSAAHASFNHQTNCLQEE